MSVLTYREAIRAGLEEALAADPETFIMGEDVGAYGGSYAVTKGFMERYGEERIIDTPISESGFVGAGIGAAIAGMRPIVEIMTINFSLLAMDQIINIGAKARYMSGGQTHRAPSSYARSAAAAPCWPRHIRRAWRHGTRGFRDSRW